MIDVLLSNSSILILLAGIACFIGCGWFAFKIFDGRYQKVTFLVFYGNTLRKMIFRTMGTMVVRDNMFDILLNKPQYMGEIGVQTFVLMPGPGGLQKVYLANYTNDYLFKVDKKESFNKVVEIETKKIRIGDEAGGILFPITYSAPAKLEENDIRTGKAIVERFKMNAQANREFLNGNNPIMAIIYSSLPTMLIVISLGVLMYLSITAMHETTLKLIEKADVIAANLNNLT